MKESTMIETMNTEAKVITKTETCVKFQIGGRFLMETCTRVVSRRAIDALGFLPTRFVCGFRFYTRNETQADINGRILSDVRRSDESPMHWIGEAQTIDDVRALAASDRRFGILLSNMESNGWNRVVRTHTGNYQPLNDSDAVHGPDEFAWPA